MKVCRVCNKEKSLDSFYIHNKKTGVYRKDCKDCTKKRNSKNTMPAEYFREHHLKKKYGMTLDDYDQMLNNQEGKCKICGSTDPKGKGRFHVDHCHESGDIRGLLCQMCNNALGLFNDDTSIMLRAIEYIKNHRDGDKNV